VLGRGVQVGFPELESALVVGVEEGEDERENGEL